ncbi:MAG: hypothetical protein IH872_02690 [Chloroflexi bacterium]|nr:hypothetical protein [Chloroflexota bacterium]
MGHERIGVLPQTKAWRDVIDGISSAINLEIGTQELAWATLENVRNQFRRIHEDPGVAAAFKFLLELSRSSLPNPSVRGADTPEIELASNPSILRIVISLRAWVDEHRVSTEYADLAKKAAADVITAWSNQQSQQPSLFSGAIDSQEIWRRAANGSGFCEVSRLFFARFTERYLNYFLDRAASAVLPSASERDQFAAKVHEHLDDISKYAFETSRITQSFAAGWFNLYALERAPSNQELTSFLSIAFGKIRDELSREAR